MAGHRHEECKTPLLSFRYRHRYWVCDCGKEWIKNQGTMLGRTWKSRKSADDYFVPTWVSDYLHSLQRDVLTLKETKKDKKGS